MLHHAISASVKILHPDLDLSKSRLGDTLHDRHRQGQRAQREPQPSCLRTTGIGTNLVNILSTRSQFDILAADRLLVPMIDRDAGPNDEGASALHHCRRCRCLPCSICHDQNIGQGDRPVVASGLRGAA